MWMDATTRASLQEPRPPDRHLAPGAPPPRAWRARLELEFTRRETRTVLTGDRHTGPLLVQKTLYPEGDEPCHAIVLHPPAGIAAGDELALAADVGPCARALLTTPGATKWYRSAGSTAGSRTSLRVADGAVLEYLPREAIVFDGARADVHLEMDLATDARLIGWDLWCLGRTASGEAFRTGRLKLATCLRRNGRLCWEERGALDGGAPLLRSAAGFAAQPVYGTLWAAGPDAPRAVIAACRAVPLGAAGRGAVTQLPELLLARYLGPSTEEAFAWFTALWALLRPAYAGREAVRPRIWSV
jgi:urease accessory protein